MLPVRICWSVKMCAHFVIACHMKHCHGVLNYKLLLDDFLLEILCLALRLFFRNKLSYFNEKRNKTLKLSISRHIRATMDTNVKNWSVDLIKIH